MRWFQKALSYVRRDIWRIKRSSLSRGKSFFLTFFRIVILSVRGFDGDKCNLRASALTFYSLISIVPVFAMAFGIAKGFGFEKLLERQLRQQLVGQEAIIQRVIEFANSLLKNTQGGLIAGIGVVVLFWAVIKVLGHIENSLNDIWSIKETRSYGRRFIDYLSLMLIGPIIIILAGGINVFITTQVNLIVEEVAILGKAGSVIIFLLEFTPYFILSVLFTFLYIFMPNTKVQFSTALIGGVVSGTAFQVVQWAYITFQVGVAKYNAIYGSFAALPLFLIWLQTSWVIFLYGAELCFAYQNVHMYEFEPDALAASHRIRMLLSLMVAGDLNKRFASGEKPSTASEISDRLEIPMRLVEDILHNLVASGVLSFAEVGEDGHRGYQPARHINSLTIKSVMDALNRNGQDAMPFGRRREFEALSASLDAFDRAVTAMPENKLLKDI